jgi:hypothetical protein
MKRLLIYTLSTVFLVAGGCDDFGDTNVNPNASVTPLTSALLTGAQSTLGNSTTGGSNFITGLYAQYFSLTQYTDNSLYATQDVTWGGEMAGNIFDLQNIININSDPATAAVAALQGSNNNQIAIARILKAYRMSILTDRYGDIPYFEALQGNTLPKLDPQEEIYADLFKELDEAVAQFDDAGNVKGDIVYGGDNLKWKKFANSLRCILALRVSEVDETLGETQFSDALASDGGVFASNDDNATLVYPGGAYLNPWVGIAADQGVSDVVAGMLNGNEDMRKYAFGKPKGDGTLVGFPYGLLRDDAVAWGNANAGWSLILNDDFRSNTSTLFILTYADVLLAQSEAALRGWIAGDEQDFYDDAMEASWDQWGVYDAADFATFMAKPANNLSTNAAEKIATQRWLTFFPNGPQGWSEWRRTGFPALTPTSEAVNESGEIPLRFPYASVEYNYNEANLDEAVARMGGDKDDTHVWWDVD